MKRFIKVIIIPVLIFASSTVNAQNNPDEASDHKAYKKGAKYFKYGNYVMAEEQFQLLLDSGYRDNDLITYQAQVHLELHQPHSAKEVILLSEKRNQDLDYLLAISHYYLEEFYDAYIELALVKDTALYHVDELHKRIQNSIKHYNAAQGYVIQNFGPEVNTQYQEYAAVMYEGFDELLFTSRNDSSEYTAHDGLAFETIHDTSIDSLNSWHVADPFEFHTGHEQRHDATVQVYQKGNKLITYHDGKLFVSHLENGAWEEEGPLLLHDDADGIDTHCYINDEETFVIFASDFNSGGHNLDLYVSYRNADSTWSEPENLVELNTDYDEDSPFLAGDSTLYFSSRGHGSLGGYDVFKSTYDKNRKRWSKPENLDYPINTVAEDIYYSTFGKIGFISSTRVGGYGSLDIYRILTFNEFKIEGLLIDEETKKPLPYTQIDIEYDSLYFRSYSDENGHYEMFVPVNKDMTVTFIQGSKTLYKRKYYVDVFFREKDNRVYDFHIPSEMGAAELIAHEELHGNSTLIHIEMKNDYDADSFVVSIAHDEVASWSDSLKNLYEQRRIEHFVPQPGMVTAYFDLNSQELALSVRNILDQLYKSILSVKNFTVEISGHTDPRGSMAYNQKLSVWRAQSVANYLSELGLADDKMVVKGYGETKLLDTSNSEASHAKNRRVEIKFE